jgi:hypothetical protein
MSGHLLGLRITAQARVIRAAEVPQPASDQQQPGEGVQTGEPDVR